MLNRRQFLLSFGMAGVALALPAPTWALPPETVGETGIVRRKEYKRKRWYKRRAARRSPLSRLLKNLYADMRTQMYPVITPLVAQMRWQAAGESVRWGGSNHYFDVHVMPSFDPVTTRDTLQGAVPVHSIGSAGAPSFPWAERLHR